MTSLKILAASLLFTAAPAFAADCCEERSACCEKGECCDKRDHRHEDAGKEAPKK